MRRYRVRLPLTVHTEDGSYTQGEEFEKDFSEEDEASNLDSGLLEVVPSRYMVTGASRVFETEPGGEFDAAMRMGQEAILIAGGHIEHVAHPPDGEPEPQPKPEPAEAGFLLPKTERETE